MVQALRDRVLEQMVAGKSIEEILEIVTMEDFSDYGWFHQWRRANVITMWEQMYHYREPTHGADVYERDTSSAVMEFYVREMDWRDEAGDPVCTERFTMIVRRKKDS